MKQAGLEPTADTYTTLLCSYAKVGDIAAISSTLDACEKNELYLLDKDLFDVIYTLAINGHAGHVDALLPRLRRSSGYNQDAVNLILRLTNRGQEQTAFAVLKTMPRGSRPDGELTDTGSFFVKQLIRARRPTESVLTICQEMQDSGLNARAFLVAIEAAVTGGSVELSLPLLARLQQTGQPIRQHYFWPLICAQAPAGTDAVLDVVKRIHAEFGVVVNGETVREYVIPNIAERNSEKLITLLRTVGVSVSTAATATAYNLVTADRLREAANVATSYNVYYQPGLFQRPLVQALAHTGDVDSFVRFVRQLYDGIPRLDVFRKSGGGGSAATAATEASTGADDEPIEPIVVQQGDGGAVEVLDPQQAEVLGQIVLDVIGAVRKDRVKVLTDVLRALVEQGLSVSNRQAERIQERLGSELSAEISELLGRLAAGDLEPVPIDKSTNRPSGFAQLTVEQLENMIETQQARGDNVKGLKRFLVSALFKAKDLEKTERTLKQLNDEGFVLTGGIYSQFIDLLVHHELSDRALEQFRTLRAREPDFVLDDYKVIRLIGLLVKQNRFEEAVRFAEENRRAESNAEAHSFNYNTTCWRILNGLAEEGRADDLRRLFDTLETCKLIELSNAVLGPLVKVHLVNNETQRAVDVFEEICTKHQCTPWKNDLACRLIQAEDAANLQRLTDLSTNIHGEVNSLYDLVFSFVECGRIRQARKILETPGLRSRPQKINVACERYQQEGKVEPLEGLVEATKDLNHIDRGDIYYNLLLSYCKEQQPQKALGLWTKMQEEDIQPSEQFMRTLGKYLRDNDLQVPFVEPESESAKTKRRSAAAKKAKQQSVDGQTKAAAPAETKPKKAPVAAAVPEEPKSETFVTFKRALRSAGDIDATLQAHRNLTATDKISVTDQSLFVEALLNADRQSEANRVVLEMIDRQQFPIPRIFRYYLNKAALTGDTAVLERIGATLSPETKKLVSFDNRLCHAYVASGKAEQFLQMLNDRLDAAQSDEERAAVAEKFPRGGTIGILEKHPELAGKCKWRNSHVSFERAWV